MTRTKTVKKTEQQHKTRRTPRRNRHSDKTIFVFFGFLYIFYLMISPRNVELPPWYGQ